MMMDRLPQPFDFLLHSSYCQNMHNYLTNSIVLLDTVDSKSRTDKKDISNVDMYCKESISYFIPNK